MKNPQQKAAKKLKSWGAGKVHLSSDNTIERIDSDQLRLEKTFQTPPAKHAFFFVGKSEYGSLILQKNTDEGGMKLSLPIKKILIRALISQPVLKLVAKRLLKFET